MDKVLEPKPTRVKISSKANNKAPIEKATDYTEKEMQIRNIQLKQQWELK